MEREGVVTAKSQYGIMLDNEDQWFNWSKKEEHKSALQKKDTVKKGDTVGIDHEGTWITALHVYGPSQDVTPSATSEPSGADKPFGDADVAIPKQVALYAAVQGLHAAVLGGTKIENAEKAAGFIIYLHGELIELLKSDGS